MDSVHRCRELLHCCFPLRLCPHCTVADEMTCLCGPPWVSSTMHSAFTPCIQHLIMLFPFPQPATRPPCPNCVQSTNLVVHLICCVPCLLGIQPCHTTAQFCMPVQYVPAIGKAQAQSSYRALLHSYLRNRPATLARWGHASEQVLPQRRASPGL